MSRLTGIPIEDKNYKVRKPKEQDWENAIQNSINKLGKLEDLMEEYNLESIEDLENLLALQTFKVGGRLNGKSIIAKGILYNQLSDELGCPLEVSIRGFIDSNKLNDDHDFKQKIMIYNCGGKLIEGFEMQLSYGENIDIAVDGADNNNDYDIETITVQIKDYGKTWWLKGEKDEQSFK